MESSNIEGAVARLESLPPPPPVIPPNVVPIQAEPEKTSRGSIDGSPNETNRKRLRRSYKSKTFKVEISYGVKIPINTIADALSGQESQSFQEAIRVLYIILRQNAAKQKMCNPWRKKVSDPYPKDKYILVPYRHGRVYGKAISVTYTISCSANHVGTILSYPNKAEAEWQVKFLQQVDQHYVIHPERALVDCESIKDIMSTLPSIYKEVTHASNGAVKERVYHYVLFPLDVWLQQNIPEVIKSAISQIIRGILNALQYLFYKRKHGHRKLSRGICITADFQIYLWNIPSYDVDARTNGIKYLKGMIDSIKRICGLTDLDQYPDIKCFREFIVNARKDDNDDRTEWIINHLASWDMERKLQFLSDMRCLYDEKLSKLQVFEDSVKGSSLSSWHARVLAHDRLNRILEHRDDCWEKFINDNELANYGPYKQLLNGRKNVKEGSIVTFVHNSLNHYREHPKYDEYVYEILEVLLSFVPTLFYDLYVALHNAQPKTGWTTIWLLNGRKAI